MNKRFHKTATTGCQKQIFKTNYRCTNTVEVAAIFVEVGTQRDVYKRQTVRRIYENE